MITHPEAPLVLDLSAQVQVHRGHQQSVPVTRVTRVLSIALYLFIFVHRWRYTLNTKHDTR